jgi:elongation factor P--(R)-beta-lysine ligase
VTGGERARLAGRRAHLIARAAGLRAVRDFFAARDFLEVETPLRVRAPALEVHLTAVPAGDGHWLITSPEFQMKRLLAGGLPRIVQVGKCFRAEEEGHQHASEFTMIEWYRAGEGLEAILADTEALVAEVARAVRGEPVVEVGGRRIAVAGPWPRLTVAEAMARFAGVTVRGDEPAEELAARVDAAGIRRSGATAWDDVFFTAFVERVEPALAALDHPIVLTDWPVELAALARRAPGNPAVVERFEAYLGGIELANAFGELTDPVEQRARFAADQATRAARGRPVYPIDERLLAALAEGLPPCAGIALGFDRLLMLVLGAAHIRDVLSFAADEL